MSEAPNTSKLRRRQISAIRSSLPKSDPVESVKRGRGSPAVVEKFHEWMAAHYLWMRAHGDKEIIVTAQVCEVWGVAKTVVMRAVRRHRTEAAVLAANIGAGDGNFAIMARAYVKLADAEVAESADAFRALIRE